MMVMTKRAAPIDSCLTDLDRLLGEERDPGAHHYLVPGTVPNKEKNGEVLGAHANYSHLAME